MCADTLRGLDAARPRIIQGKLAVPALPDHHSPRARVEERIAQALASRRAVVVSATAGAGKTTAVVGALARHPRDVAWLTVDRSDRAPGRLLTYLEAAVARVVPGAAGVATEALAEGLAHAEAAGLLAEALEGHPLVLVLDELERLEEAADPWRVLEAFLRYAPQSVCAVLISRREIPTRLCALPSPEMVASVRDPDVAFTPDEAHAALVGAGRADVDAAAVVDRMAGWVTGVLFEAWRGGGEPLGLAGGETDPVFEYLSAHILGQLDPRDREFLVLTSLLDEVDVLRAEALGFDDGADRLAALRRVHLPAGWDADRGVLRCHSFFREYLQRQVSRRGAAEMRALRRQIAAQYAREGHHEEAVEEYLRAGAPEEALGSAEKVILQVLDRADFAVAERWLAALEPPARPEGATLVTARLMLAIGRDDVSAGVRLADGLGREAREQLARSSERALWLMVWAYLHAARPQDVEALVAVAPPGPGREAARWALRVLGDVPGALGDDPPSTGDWLLDAMVLIVNYPLGRLSHWLDADGPTGWARSVAVPYRIAALRALGRTDEALQLYEAVTSNGTAPPSVGLFAGPELFTDLGRLDEAEALLDANRRFVAESGSLAFLGLHRLSEAKLAARHLGDPERALAVLDAPDVRLGLERIQFLDEAADTWTGFALLRLGRDDEALERLRRCVATMHRTQRLLELPTAAVYLAEAAWRAGEEDEADAATDIALAAAERQGSRHLLLQALADFPAVASRRMDAEPDPDGPWHDISRALAAWRPGSAVSVRSRVALGEFGRREIVVDGVEVRPRIAKAYELLAYLAAVDAPRVPRGVLLDVLFDGRRDDAARAYLRQAIHWLRQVLPDDVLDVRNEGIALAAPVSSESAELERRLLEAAGQQGDARVAAVTSAIGVFEQGEYLPGPHGEWADERARSLARIVNDARHGAAVAAYGAGRLHEARAMVAHVTAQDPYREAAWRLAMRIADALGDQDAVLTAYRGCEASLAAVGAQPSEATRRLFASLRR